jgi:HEAT repeats
VRIYDFSVESPLEDFQENPLQPMEHCEVETSQPEETIQEPWRDERQYYTWAIETLKSSTDPETIDPLVARLMGHGMLLEALCDPELNRAQAVALGRNAIRITPAVDAALARALADSQTGQGAVVIKDAGRVMDLLCEVGDASRMMTSMLRLLRHTDPRLRSRAVKIVGRGSKSPTWVRNRLNDPDPRARANAIESLWSLDTAAVHGLLRFAAREDGHPRVTANALLGLYYLGDIYALRELVNMAANASGGMRASAAWAMGETGDLRFRYALRQMLNDEDKIARKRALSALARIKALQPPAGSPWHVAATVSQTDQKGWRRLLVSVAGDDAGELPPVPPLGFALSESGSPVMSYKVVRRAAPPPMSVVFVLPRGTAGPIHEGIESCLKWKRPQDLWSLIPYAGSIAGVVPDAIVDPTAPSFSGDVEFLSQALVEPAGQLECGDLWISVWRAAKLEPHMVPGIRHVLLLSTSEESRAAGRAVLAQLRNPHVRMQAIGVGGNRRVQEFCREIGASFRPADPDGIAEVIRHTYLSLLGRYEISYGSDITSAAGLKLRVQAPGGSGETTVPYALLPKMGAVATG